MRFYRWAIAGFCLIVMLGMPGLRVTGSSEEQAISPAYLSPRWSHGLSGGRIEDSSPTLYDLDGDGRLEIVIGTTKNGASPVLAVLEDDGTVKWQVALPDPVNSSPAVADISYPPGWYPGDPGHHRRRCEPAQGLHHRF